MAESTQEPSGEVGKSRVQEREEERIGETNNRQEFEPGLPVEDSGAFKSEFGFVVA